MAPGWRDRRLADLLAAHGLAHGTERAFPNDGWSGARFTSLEDHDGRRLVLKRTSLAQDWIARWTRDDGLREGWLAAAIADGSGSTLGSTGNVSAPYLGAAADADGVAILMPDLSAELIAWDRPGMDATIDPATLARVVGAVAALHRSPWASRTPGLPWCPLAERLTLLTRRAAFGYAAEGLPVGEQFLAGWDAFERLAPAPARRLIGRLGADPAPLVAALGTLPSVGLHGDLKLANVALLGDGETDDGVAFIDWQMALRAPVAVELGWFLVSNSHSLAADPESVMAGYRAAATASAGGEAALGDWAAQLDLAWIVGLLMRGWRKGLDAEAGAILASGVTAADDLAWWCAQAVAAAERRFLP